MDARARHDSGGIAPMDLIGREAEIERLRLLLSQIATGAGDALLLSGDPGVGKTSLLGAAAALAAEAGIRPLRATGRSSRRTSPTPPSISCCARASTRCHSSARCWPGR